VDNEKRKIVVKVNSYEKILNYCYKEGAWMTSGDEVWKWRRGI
jgi:hypothetical protein